MKGVGPLALCFGAKREALYRWLGRLWMILNFRFVFQDTSRRGSVLQFHAEAHLIAGVVFAGLIDEETRSAFKRFRHRLDGGLVGLLLERRSEIGHSDPETAARFVVDQLSAMLWARLDRVMTPTQLEDRDDADFVAETVRSASAYLQLRADS